jgi:multiple sugar transport system permease protein
MNKVKDFFWSIRSFFHQINLKISEFFIRHHLGFLVRWPNWAKAAIFLLPAVGLLGVFTFWPIVNAFQLVIYRGYNLSDGTITGYTVFGNFLTVLNEDNFIFPTAHTHSSILLNTVAIVFLSVPIAVFIALGVASALNRIKGLKNLFQTIYFLPYVTNSIAIGLVFAYMFQKQNTGLVNQLMELFGVIGEGEQLSWIDYGATYWRAMAVLIIYAIWSSLAFKIMVFTTAIQGIDKQYYQAAAIDSTPKSRVFRRITVPMISPMIFYVVITSVIGGFKTYSSVVAIFGDTGQPAGADFNLKTIVFYIYDYLNNAVPGNMSLAAASSLILFAFILVLTLIQMQVSKKRVHY